jgi:hypothetical protein
MPELAACEAEIEAFAASGLPGEEVPTVAGWRILAVVATANWKFLSV